MSYVSSYLLFTNEQSIALRIAAKMYELDGSDDVVNLIKLEYDSAGTKFVQFADAYCFAFNHFPDDDFQEWFSKQKFEDVQLFLQKEHEDRLKEVG